MDPLWRHVVWGSDQRVRCCRLIAEKSAEAEVTKFNNTLSGDKHVGGFNICGSQKKKVKVSFSYLNFGAMARRLFSTLFVLNFANFDHFDFDF